MIMIHWNFDETVNDFEHRSHASIVLKVSLHTVSPSPDQKSFLSHLPIVSSYCAQYRQCGAVLFQAVRLACRSCLMISFSKSQMKNIPADVL